MLYSLQASTPREKKATAIRAESAFALKQSFTITAIKMREEKKRDTGVQENYGNNHDRRSYIDPETNEEYWPWMFSKTLEHDKITGFAKKNDIKSILKARRNPINENLSSIASSASVAINDRRLIEGVTADLSFNLIGTDNMFPTVNTYYHVDSSEGVYEMSEVYIMSLMRDTPFSEFAAKACEAIDELNSFDSAITGPTKEGKITHQTLFRGNGIDETTGPYVSQFLYLPFYYGNIRIDQKYIFHPDAEETTNHQRWLDVQNGKKFKQAPQTSAKYCHSPRVLGSKVHMDPLFQFYYNAALICLQNGISPSGFDNKQSSIWTSSGGPDILATVAHVALGALRVAWHNKFSIGMKIRPEVYAQRVDLAMSDFDASQVPGLSEIKRLVESHIPKSLSRIHQQGNKSYRLKLQYAAGSPTHPSWPAGHACVAGACTTVLKAMFKCHYPNRKKLPWISRNRLSPKHSVDGDTLVDYPHFTNKMTIIGEFNKLASNVSLGRDFAGVHYRCDGESGMALGEQYAITYLVDKCKEYNESETGLFKGFLLEKFDGSQVLITANEVEELDLEQNKEES